MFEGYGFIEIYIFKFMFVVIELGVEVFKVNYFGCIVFLV